MSLDIDKDISVIVILYNTPLNKIENLKQFKNFRLIILEQGSPVSSKKRIKKILNFKFNYFYSKKNLGLSKGINFLLKKTKTKYCLITEPDVVIDKKSIINLKNILSLNKKFLLVSPNYRKKKDLRKFIITKNIDLSCVIFETKKLVKFNFYDEDFFFFWNDIDLIRRINNSKFQMVIANKSYAKHNMSSSSKKNTYISFLREKSFKYGELVFDYKHNNLRFIKILRQFIQSFVGIFLGLLIMDKKKIITKLGYFFGILSFLTYMINR